MRHKSLFLWIAGCLLLLADVAVASTQEDADRLFNWAEDTYPDLFSPSGQSSDEDATGVWYYRYYPDSSNYVGVNNADEVWVLGDVFGGMRHVGMLQALLLQVDASASDSGFAVIDDQAWDETAVRKVLHIFAYGGHATDAQITQWANMSPQSAIEEILAFTPSNLKLSPSSADELGRKTDGTLQSLSHFWSSNDPENTVPEGFRQNYIIDNFYTSDCYADLPDYYHHGNFIKTWIHSVLAKGSNPFMHKIGFWETNYHMVANSAVSSLSFWHLMRHYDNILRSFMADAAYEDILATGALSSVIALQYGHANEYWIDGNGGRNGNYFEDGLFYGNEDFAREFHQLFFGVLGEQDHDYHETITIRNTAKALSDIRHKTIDLSSQCDYDTAYGWPDAPEFATRYHPAADLEVYHQTISGANAKQKIEMLAGIAINQEESLQNLPILIVAGLADDNLTPEKINVIQNEWRAMQPKNLLTFLRRYAISSTFHSPDRIKYYTSFDRNLIVYNRLDIDNSELHRITNEEKGWRWSLPEDIAWQAFENENVQPFRPIHDVFGHQKGIEAIGTPGVFRSVYNRSAEPWSYNYTVIREDGNWENILWSKDMTKVIRPDQNGRYSVKHVSEVLWRRFVADGLKNFGVLEKAHLYSILADFGLDLGMRFKQDGLVDSENYVFSKQELQNNPAFIAKLTELANQSMALDSSDIEEKTRANERINLALAFISATPYLFLQEGK